MLQLYSNEVMKKIFNGEMGVLKTPFFLFLSHSSYFKGRFFKIASLDNNFLKQHKFLINSNLSSQVF